MAEGVGRQEGDTEGYKKVCDLADLRTAGRKRVNVGGRIVVLFHVSNQVYAMDHFCYR